MIDLKSLASQMHMGMPSGPSVGPAGMHAAPEAVKAASKAPGNPVSHLSTALAHAKAGKHPEAKKHALKAVNVLHRMAPAAAPAGPAAPSGAPAAP